MATVGWGLLAGGVCGLVSLSVGWWGPAHPKRLSLRRHARMALLGATKRLEAPVGMRRESFLGLTGGE